MSDVLPTEGDGQPPRDRRGRRASRSNRWLRIVLFGLAAVIVFVLGLVVGQALEDRPSPGGVQTIVRTLEPLPQEEP